MIEKVKGANWQPDVFRQKKLPIVVLVTMVDEPTKHIIFQNRNALRTWIDGLGQGKKWTAEARYDDSLGGLQAELRRWHIVRMDGLPIAYAQEMEVNQ